jgi:large subunit ribosomal protein L28
MGMQCAVSGKKPVGGNKLRYRGKAKYLGGVGKKITGKTKRRFKPNLQRIQIQDENGAVKTVRVAVSVIRSGLVKKPLRRKPFQIAKV